MYSSRSRWMVRPVMEREGITGRSPRLRIPPFESDSNVESVRRRACLEQVPGGGRDLRGDRRVPLASRVDAVVLHPAAAAGGALHEEGQVRAGIALVRDALVERLEVADVLGAERGRQPHAEQEDVDAARARAFHDL